MSDQAPALKAPPAPTDPADYDSILAAVMETGRGRWFLHEFARRNRSADTGTVLAAIERIEALLQSRNDPDTEPVEAVAPPAPAAADAARAIDAMALQSTIHRMREIADNLIECGAPAYLCSDLIRQFQLLETSLSSDRDHPPFVRARENEATTEMPTDVVRAEESKDIATPSRDPFSDIRALSQYEKIAIFT